MALWRRLCVGVSLAVMVTAGCGRAGSELAVPAVQAISFAPESGTTASAQGQVADMGVTIEVRLSGQGFQPNGMYSVQPLVGYRSGAPGGYTRSGDALPEPMPALADGRVQLLTSFQRRGTERAWTGLGVFFHPNGDAADARTAQLVLFAPFPDNL
jgi:hypothetical protein